MRKIFAGTKGRLAAASLFALALAVIVCSALPSNAQGPRHGWGMWGPHSNWHRQWRGPDMSPWHRLRMERHWRFMHGEIPKEYQNVQNPIDNTTEAIEQGGRLYASHCARCHGSEGLGNGVASKDLNPSPTLLAFLIQRPIAIDEYLVWTISEGGKDFGSEMPAFKDDLGRDNIWKVIAYMRSGFPSLKKP